jgi:hypothetical protein
LKHNTASRDLFQSQLEEMMQTKGWALLQQIVGKSIEQMRDGIENAALGTVIEVSRLQGGLSVARRFYTPTEEECTQAAKDWAAVLRGDSK